VVGSALLDSIGNAAAGDADACAERFLRAMQGNEQAVAT
jgi:hypothetical protein